MNPTKYINSIECYSLFSCLQRFNVILEIGITLTIKIDQLRLFLILNNYTASHIADNLDHFSSGSSPYWIDGFTPRHRLTN